MSMLQQAIEHYKPGGEFATVRAEQLKGKVGTVKAGMESQLVGRGLAGTTVGAAIPAAIEQQVAAPWRTETEMMRGGRLMEAVLAGAGFEERKLAREQEEKLARDRMALQEQLTRMGIGAQEQQAILNRWSQEENARLQREQQQQQWEAGRLTTAGAAPTQPSYEFPSAPSLVSAGVGGGELPEVGPVLEPAPEDWFTAQEEREGFNVSQWFEPGGWLAEAPTTGPAGLPTGVGQEKPKRAPSAYGYLKALAEKQPWALKRQQEMSQ